MNPKPLVSIVMPCYNMGEFVGQALRSVGAQSYLNWELLGVDDFGSQDGTSDEFGKFDSTFPDNKVSFTRHEQNRGVSAARNTAISNSTGEYIAFLDPDDYWDENYLLRMIQHIETTRADVVYCRMMIVDSKGENARINGSPTEDDIRRFPDSLYQKNFIGPSCLISKSTCFDQAGTFDENPDLQHVEDWDMWIRFVAQGLRFEFLDDALCQYRKHPNAATLVAHDVALKRRHALWLKHVSNPEFMSCMIQEHVAAHLELQKLRGHQSRIGNIVAWPFHKLGQLFS